MPRQTRRPGQGPLGRVFNRIVGASDTATDTGDMAFNQKQLQNYVDKHLQFAEGEWFRGKKLSGASQGLIEKLDKSGDGMVTWTEFQAFRTEILATMVPSLQEEATPEQVEEAAGNTFEEVDQDADGQVGLEEAKDNANEALPAETEHKDLIAQLGARLVLDAVDTDNRDQKVANRRVSRSEWVTAAQELKKSP